MMHIFVPDNATNTTQKINTEDYEDINSWLLLLLVYDFLLMLSSMLSLKLKYLFLFCYHVKGAAFF